MAHDLMILGDVRAVGRKYAWHNLNRIFEGTAEEVVEQLHPFDIQTVPVHGTCPFTGNPLVQDNYLIVREPQGDERVGQVLGRPVGSGFEVITPRQAGKAFTKAVRYEDGSPVIVEQAGFLGNGDRMWITAKMEDFDITVPGSGSKIPHENYILYWNSMSPDVACRVLYTSVCVVCWNTAQMALKHNQIDVSVQHQAGALERLETALMTVWSGGKSYTKEAKAIGDRLIRKPISDELVEEIICDVFPEPGKPKTNLIAKTDYKDRMKNYEYRLDLCKAMRKATRHLYEGAGATNALDGVGGTAFGLYNAFTDLASHMKGDADTALMEYVEGDRGRFTTKSLKLLMEV